ncbi:MAG: GIY-YIG nuclease family protein [Gammaproteobacteria bacterium]|nr:GIY-YIG nuclease family protein [Gammaproteobacteria bacterium]MDH4315271.1 GIY-YIG nuclease family protein [Gammaproteobacteria bacterium]MDH5213963.1 GIY-YIG nuclease family protein [Gammaproteobacteria bacterium]MDH5500690.1 GIY-YIG nuclease family protein [Gammaproteobacteria bacterium]
MEVWSLYLLRCSDGSVYTGISTDVERRVRQHESGAKGAKYLRGRGPLQLLYQREIGDRSLASRVEYQVKQLSRQEKEDAVNLHDAIESLLQKMKRQFDPVLEG